MVVVAVPVRGLARRPLRRADRARTAVAQHRERVVARVVAVGPGRCHGVVADEVDVDHPRLLVGQRRVRVEPAGHARLAAAMGARAEPAQRGEVVAGRVTVLPDDVERPGGPIGVDAGRDGRRGRRGGARGRRGHRKMIAPPPCGPWSGRSGQSRSRGSGAIVPPVTLSIDTLHKRFGRVVALDGLAFDVPGGQVFGFLGANGAGKTTTMRIVLGVLEADTGVVTWRGADSRTLPRATWGYLPEERGLYPRMTVIDQLVYFGSLYGVPPDRARREAQHWLARFRVPD